MVIVGLHEARISTLVYQRFGCVLGNKTFRLNYFVFKRHSSIGLPVKNEWKQDCTHVDHSQLDSFSI